MFNKLKASLGIGAAKVDTILDSMNVHQGEVLTGVVHIQGGDVAQEIDGIKLKLCTEMKVEVEDSVTQETFTLGQLEAVEPFTIAPGESKKVPFELKLHDETPITVLNAKLNQSYVWVETTLDIDFAIDPKDRDMVEVEPHPVAQKVIDEIEAAGFTMVKADVEKGFLNGGNFASKSGCYQEIEFRNNGLINRKEIELSFIREADKLHCLAEVDRSLSLRGDQYVSFTLALNAGKHEISQAVNRVLSI